MSKNLEIALWLRLRGNAEAAAGMRRFTEQSARGLGDMRREVKQLWSDFNGFTAATKLFAAAGGLAAVRSTLNANLNFERDILEMKQNSGMLKEQADELRRLAIDSAESALQTPHEIMIGMKAFARAGEKFEDIRVKAVSAAKAATVFRASVEEIANMDFDITDKLNIDPKRLNAVHNMLYYHGNSGRFEAPQLARQAPELFNAVGAVGVRGERGLNFTGALTQVLMKYASVNDPGKVSTLMQQGLGHIVSPHYVQGLQKFGIDIKKYAPGGKFYGEGGVDGLLALVDAMKKKGLEDPFKLGQAGFADQETNKFFRALMQYSDKIRSEMAAADQAAAKDQITTDLAEIKQANFGKIKAAEIQIEKLKLSDSSGKATSFIGGMAGKLADDPDMALKGGLGIGALYLLNRARKNRNARLGESAGIADAVAGAAGVQQVFVTNWPGGMLLPGDQLKQKRAGRGGVVVPGEGEAPQKPAGKLGKLANGLGQAAAAYGGWELGYNMIGPVVRDGIDSLVSAVSGHETTLGAAIYDFLNRDPAPVKVQVEVQNGNIVASVNETATRTARRN
jgi:TP901 family phage tail tape measure protein